jgi:hypothetical protein
MKRRVKTGLVLGTAAIAIGISASACSSTSSHLVASSSTAVTAQHSPVAVAPVATTAPAAPAPAQTTAPALSADAQQAVDSAQSYLSDGQGFSYQGLLKQLTSSYGSGFPTATAVVAISYLHPDWDAQAVDAAQNYLSDGQGFSRASLLQQLTSSYGSGFTQSQAEYALGKVGM